MKKCPLRSIPLSASVILVGAKANGKTTLAQKLGEFLRVSVIDTDKELVQRFRAKNMAQLYNAMGEAEFREAEYTLIKSLIQESPKVISLGAGAILHPKTQALLKKEPYTLFLDVPAPISYLRWKTSGQILYLGKECNEKRWNEIHNQRYPLYLECSKFRIKTVSTNPELLAEEVINHLGLQVSESEQEALVYA